MPTEHQDKSVEIAKRLNADPRREAMDSQRGYDWQRWLTIQKWLELEGEDDLWIEFGEDVTTVSMDGIETVQAKDRDGTVSLGLAHIREMIELGFQRDPSVRTVLWTTSRLTLEQKKPFGEVPGITYWASVQEGSSDLAPLRQFLESSLDRSVAEDIKKLGDEELLKRIKNIQFITDEVGIEALRRRILGKLEKRLTALGVKNASVVRDNYGRALFEYVSRKSAKGRSERRLDRILLDEEILSLHHKYAIANLPSNLDQTNEVAQGLITRIGEALDAKISGAGINAAVSATVIEALEADLRNKHTERTARSLFDEAQPADEISLLGEEVLGGQYAAVSKILRQDILQGASRSSSIRGKLEDARRFLNAAETLGPDRSLKPARARLLAAEGETDGALRELRDEPEADSYSTLLSILFRDKGALEAIAEYRRTGNPTRLTANGFATMASALATTGEIQVALELLEQAPDAIIKASPMIAMRRGLLSFASLFEKEAQAGVLAGIPIDARARTNVELSQRRKALDRALSDFALARDRAQGLGLPRASAVASSYQTWAELLHPDRSGEALERLRGDIEALTPHGLLCVQFAFAFDATFEPDLLRSHLAKRSEVAGLDDNEFRAAVTVALHVDTPAEMATFVAKNRDRLNRDYGEPGTLQIEIQALAASGDAGRARELLDDGAGRLGPEVTPFLEAVVSAAEGNDPVEAYTKAYEDNPSSESLRSLLGVLHDGGRWDTFAQRAEELFERTNNLNDLADAARAYLRVGDDQNFLRLLEGHTDLEGFDPAFPKQLGWAHFRLGHLGEAKRKAGQRPGNARDIDLEIALAVETGDWESLPGIVSAYLDTDGDYSAEDLIRAARLSQIVGQGPVIELMDRAVELGPENPDILLAAYTLVLEEGLEAERPQAADWFRLAINKSGNDGPVRRVDIKELLAQSQEHTKSGLRVSAAVMDGSMPMLVAARSLGGTQLQVTLGNLVGNSNRADARDKIPLNLFAGGRLPGTFEAKVIGLDISALMTLAWLGLLPSMETTFDEIHIPAGLMTELFDGQRRIREQQKSRLRHARETHAAVTGNRLGVVAASRRRGQLEQEVGSELADLLRRAKIDGGTVLRPSPINKFGAFDGEAEVGDLATQITDFNSLIEFLVSEGRLDQQQEAVAREQSKQREDAWSNPAALSSGKPLFLDALALEYVQQARMLDVILSSFSTVFISEDSALNSRLLVDQNETSEEMLTVLASLRHFIAKGLRAGTVKSGKYHTVGVQGGGQHRSSTLNLIADLGSVDAVILDDRAINKDGFASDDAGRSVRLVNSLDVIEQLHSVGTVSKARRAQLRMRLRRAGVLLMPLEAEELVDAVRRNQAAPSPEFLAIQQNIDLTRFVEAPSFPGDIPWFANSVNAIKNAVHAVWDQKTDLERSETLSQQLLALHLAPIDWEFAWKGAPPPDWVKTVSGALLAGLAFPVAIEDPKIKKAFGKWLERYVLRPLADQEDPQYQWLVRYLIDLINSGVAWRGN